MPEAQRQFQREARVLASLTHSNLPRVSDHFTIEKQGQYLVMDFVEGQDLATMLQYGQRVNLNQALEWIAQVAGALTYLHTRTPPVVHRDVKPANIRITPDGRAMLVDFGLFKYDEPSKSTTAGARAITPGYAPPEQYGRGHTDARTDMYALAATLYALLTGHEPLESVLRIAGNQLPMANQLNPAVPSEMARVIDRAMELEPDQRFHTVQAFIDALHAADTTAVMQPVPGPVAPVALHAMTVQAAVPQETVVGGAIPPLVSPAPMPGTAEQPVQVPRKKGRGVVVGLIILLLLVGVLLVGGGIYLFSGSPESEDDTAERVQATIAAGAEATKDAGVGATATARVLPLVQEGWRLVSGPLAGGMAHEPQDGLIGAVKAPVNLKDFVMQATFFNPYASDVGSWDYGFVFRHTGPNQHYRLMVRSDRTWLLRHNDGDVDGEIIARGTFPALDTGHNAANTLKLVAQGERGEFFINDSLVQELDLSARSNPGAVYLVTGVLRGDEVAGYETGFQDFSVWSAP
jgi:hypothetical protein